MNRLLQGAALPALAAIALLGGCASLAPCDHEDLQGRYGLLCAVRGVQSRTAPQRDARGLLIGSVSAEGAEGPIVVFAYRRRADEVEVVDASMLPGPGPYRIAVPAGIYRIAAFEDDNGDLRYDPTRERAALYHDGGTVVVRSGEPVDRLYLQLRDDRPQRLDFEFTLPGSLLQACCDIPASAERPIAPSSTRQ